MSRLCVFSFFLRRVSMFQSINFFKMFAISNHKLWIFLCFPTVFSLLCRFIFLLFHFLSPSCIPYVLYVFIETTMERSSQMFSYVRRQINWFLEFAPANTWQTWLSNSMRFIVCDLREREREKKKASPTMIEVREYRMKMTNEKTSNEHNSKRKHTRKKRIEYPERQSESRSERERVREWAVEKSELDEAARKDDKVHPCRSPFFVSYVWFRFCRAHCAMRFYPDSLPEWETRFVTMYILA